MIGSTQPYKVNPELTKFFKLPTSVCLNVADFLESPLRIINSTDQASRDWNTAQYISFKARLSNMVENPCFAEYSLRDIERKAIEDVRLVLAKKATRKCFVKLMHWIRRIGAKKNELNEHFLKFFCLFKEKQGGKGPIDGKEGLVSPMTMAWRDYKTRNPKSNILENSSNQEYIGMVKEYLNRNPELCDPYDTVHFEGNFHSLPNEIELFKNLREIFISRVYLTPSLLSHIGKLEKLTTLALEFIEINYFPEEILSLNKTLTSLTLTCCHIRSIPSNIKQLKLLKYLNLKANGLEILPEEIGELTQLKEIYLSHNSIRSLPSTLNQLAHLEKLNINSFHLLTNQSSKWSIYACSMEYKLLTLNYSPERELKSDLKYLDQLRTDDFRARWSITVRCMACIQGQTLREHKEWARGIFPAQICEKTALREYNIIPSKQLLKLIIDMPNCKIFY